MIWHHWTMPLRIFVCGITMDRQSSWGWRVSWSRHSAYLKHLCGVSTNALICSRSNSLYRSASALAALIRVSLCVILIEIYCGISRIEPIFHLETLTRSLHCLHPEKKYFSLLAKLARVTVIAVREPSLEEIFDPFFGNEVLQLSPSPETALRFRHRLIRTLMLYRKAHKSLCKSR